MSIVATHRTAPRPLVEARVWPVTFEQYGVNLGAVSGVRSVEISGAESPEHACRIAKAMLQTDQAPAT